jgi:hypothetical protein
MAVRSGDGGGACFGGLLWLAPAVLYSNWNSRWQPNPLRHPYNFVEIHPHLSIKTCNINAPWSLSPPIKEYMKLPLSLPSWLFFSSSSSSTIIPSASPTHLTTAHIIFGTSVDTEHDHGRRQPRIYSTGTKPPKEVITLGVIKTAPLIFFPIPQGRAP